MTKPQRSITRDSACPIQDLRDSIGWHLDLSRQLSRAHVKSFQFFGEVFTWMDGSNWHSGAY
jgi:hypothetical protein